MSHSTTEPAVTTGEITSADGTRIGYRILGSGPGVVLLHGAMSSGYHHLHLARLLADRFTAYLPDRRGRGLSGPYRPDDGLDTEVEDLAALLADPAQARATLARFERALAAGDVNRALAIAMKGAQMGLALLRAMPDALLVRLTAMAMRAESRKPSEYVPMSVLAPALRHDLRVVATLSGQPRRFSAITADVLLMGGSKSPKYLKDALTSIELALPAARRIEFAGLDHAAPWNDDRGGRPGPVAAELRQFFA
ncbi:MAG: alpha/beta hydrolase [Micromonosporaceae bacterium]